MVFYMNIITVFLNSIHAKVRTIKKINPMSFSFALKCIKSFQKYSINTMDVFSFM